MKMKLSSALILICFACVSINVQGQKIIKTRQTAAQGLYQAWSKKRRKTAQNYAPQDAIDKLFGVTRRAMKFKGCSKMEEENLECIYEDKKNDLSVAMIVKIFGVGCRVTEVSFSSEAI
jgi:hypothetical protein